MKYRLLGKTGIEVSELCLGTMAFGGPADEKESARIFKFCRDKGINFFDCANVYEKGLSEIILGKLISDSRFEVAKVVWPSRGETTQMTIVVLVMVLLLALVFWGLDSLLSFLSKFILS